MNPSYVQIGLLLLALFALVHMTQHYSTTTDKLSAATSLAAGKASQVAGKAANSIHDVLVHPLDTLAGTGQAISGVWGGGPVAPVSPGSISTGTATGSMITNGAGNASLLGSAKEGLAVQPVDYDSIFKPNSIQPADLIPKVDPALFPGVTADLNQSFMVNELQSGLPTSSRRKYIHDTRPIYPPPITATTPFLNPTTFPDMNRRSICDL